MNLKDHFPRASKSFLSCNSGTLSHTGEKNCSQPIVATRRGKGRGMNQSEREFSMLLEMKKHKGEIVNWQFESVKIRIGEGCWYIPDFFVPRLSRPLFIEVKGFMRDDARVKFLAAQEQHKWADFEMWRKVKGQGWTQIL